MELLDRYLNAVGSNLPPKKRDDILRELRANILEGVEEREAANGRRLTLEEEEAVLKEYGHPAVVGLRYWPKQYLIGPSVFPYYIYALKTVVPLALLVYSIVNAVVLAVDTLTPRRIVDVLVGMPWAAFLTAAWITLAFVVLEYAQSRGLKKIEVFEDWKPRALPQVPERHPHSGWRARAELAGSSFALIWFLLVPHFPFLMFGPAARQLQYITLAPQWTAFYWAFMGVLFAQWLIEVSGMFLPRVRSIRPLLGWLGRAATAVLFALMLRVPTYLWVNDAGLHVKDAKGLVDALNLAIGMGLKAIVAIFVVQLLWDLVQMAMGRDTSAAGLRFHGHAEGK